MVVWNNGLHLKRVFSGEVTRFFGAVAGEIEGRQSTLTYLPGTAVMS